MVCENCGGPLVVRSDDTVETIQNRIQHYLPKINEVIAYYSEMNLPFVEINGEGSVDEVSKLVKEQL